MLDGLKLEGPKGKRAPREWSVYILRCGDGSYYTGIAKDVEARLEKHNSGKGAAYTRTHRPVSLAYREDRFTRSGALIREAAIKSLGRPGKARLVGGGKKAAGRRARPA
ncbi:MAG: GIY-YIG nuclease family protein [Elusimicrobia bacterium]|nr:GIY-YIG nuclease family protein [Elusimicrobiota bacterium]